MVRRPALHPQWQARRQEERLHFLHLGAVGGRHRAGRGGTHHRHVGDERLPEGSPRPDAVGALACGGLPRRWPAELAATGREAAWPRPRHGGCPLRVRAGRHLPQPDGAWCAGARHRASHRAAGLRYGRAGGRRQPVRAHAGQLRHRHRAGAGQPAGPDRGRSVGADRTAGHGQPGRCGAADEAVHRARHLRVRPLRVRQHADPGQPGRCRHLLPHRWRHGPAAAAGRHAAGSRDRTAAGRRAG